MIGLQRRIRYGVTLVELLVVIGIIAVLIGLLLPAVQRVRDAANRLRCASNLRQIGLALHQYHDTNEGFPPGTSYRMGRDPQPFMNWHVRILPFLEQSEVWSRVQKAFQQEKLFWKDPPHEHRTTVIQVFGCPADGRVFQPGQCYGLTVAFTSYLGVLGLDHSRKEGILFVDSRIRFAGIVDGTSSTILVGERPPSADLSFGWWYAGTGQVDEGSGDSVLGVRERNISPKNRTCSPGPYTFGPGRVQEQCDAFHFWSLHAGGGANFLFADGSVHFLPYSANTVMPALATRSGGETAALPD